MALAAVFPAAALSMPMLVGRKKREEPRREDNIHLPLGLSDNDDEDTFVKHFTTENERELKQKDIAAANCRRMVYDRRSDATREGPATPKDHVDQLKLLLCPSDKEPTVWNMILLDGKSV